jgi:hypothetical protein
MATSAIRWASCWHRQIGRATRGPWGVSFTRMVGIARLLALSFMSGLLGSFNLW